MIDITPPSDIQTERFIIGALMLDPVKGIQVVKELSAEDFYKKDHANIFKTILNLHDEGEPIDVLTVANRCNGNTSYFTQIVSETPTAANLAYHARIIKSLSIKRIIMYKSIEILRDIEENDTEELTAKWVEFAKTLDSKGIKHKEINLTHKIEQYIEATDGDFTATECYKWLQTAIGATKGYKTEVNRRSVKDILIRLKKRGVIQKIGNKDGVYRQVDEEADEIDFESADDSTLDIRWPFEIEKFVDTYPKSISVIAGAPNAGKTAFLLNLVRLNIQKHKINYFSSEMGKIELKARLLKFGLPLSEWKRAIWKERAVNFADVIKPDEINIIDFLELHSDFFLVGQMIKDIFDKLNKGIAVIALQKNAGQDHGLGGYRSIEKARLYVAMDTGTVKIVKGKNWHDETKNPNGYQNGFKLVQGCKFIADGWLSPDDIIDIEKERKYKGFKK